MKTELKDRTLWYDGSSTVSVQNLLQLVKSGQFNDKLFVDTIDDEVLKYNKFVPPQKRLQVKNIVNDLDFKWNIPEQYKILDVEQFIIDKLVVEGAKLSEEESIIREQRVVDELLLYKKRGLVDILRLVIYIINTLNEQKIIFGVGRGSSVSSYILYLIGAHDVDSVRYELDIHDFLKIGE